MRAGWTLGVVALVAAGGLLAGIVVGSTPGARTAAVRALGGLPDLLRPDLVGLAQPAPPGSTVVGPVIHAPVLPGAAVAPTPSPRPTMSPSPALSPTATSTPSPTTSAASSPTSSPTSSPAPSPTSSPASSPARKDAAATPCAPTARACVDLSANRSWLLEDGRVTHGPVPITHGRAGFRTPPGTFRVQSKRRDHVSSIYDAAMPWSVFFNGGIAFHQGSLDVLSHGCVHLSSAAARTYFASLEVGDVVQVVP